MLAFNWYMMVYGSLRIGYDRFCQNYSSPKSVGMEVNCEKSCILSISCHISRFQVFKCSFLLLSTQVPSYPSRPLTMLSKNKAPTKCQSSLLGSPWAGSFRIPPEYPGFTQGQRNKHMQHEQSNERNLLEFYRSLSLPQFQGLPYYWIYWPPSACLGAPISDNPLLIVEHCRSIMNHMFCPSLEKLCGKPTTLAPPDSSLSTSMATLHPG